MSCSQMSDNVQMMADGAVEFEQTAKSANVEEYTEAETPKSIDDLAKDKIAEKIIKTANVSVEVADYDASISEIKKRLRIYNAYVSSEVENNTSYLISNSLTIRVASEKFDNLLDTLIVDVKKVIQKSVSLTDVTEEFVDIEARLKAKKEIETRYYEILKKANTISEILEVEYKIKQIREEIDAAEGRLKFLNNQVGYSTINLTVNQYNDYNYNEPSFFSKLGDAISSGWSGLIIFIIGIFYLWPLWLILGITLYVILKLVKRSKKKK
ncbi:MAG: hypothetical protein A2265_03165 [Bacteroidetes bacterium RIFOXYA12_FULL_33_9]|nr:MAG: hypothetical protein A2265_03165 [Bacteroidetes bacterium RIFOXYA12_FULL_33_9]